MKLGHGLKTLRKSRGLTLVELSQLTGVSNPFLSQLENGKNEASWDTLQKLAAGFNISTVDFLVSVGLIERSEIETSQMRPQSINELCRSAHHNAIYKGWYDEPKSFGDLIALIHSELSEALEEYRDGRKVTEGYYEGAKPCGIPIELADAVIRIFDMCGHYGIDLEAAIIEKMAYNATRPQRHGGKKL